MSSSSSFIITIFCLMSLTFMQPVNIIALLSSLFKMEITFSTPAQPLVARPKRIGLPTKTRSAPRAIAFKTSVPLLTPPSKQISVFDPYRAYTISGNASIVVSVVSRFLAPWLLTQTASQPASLAISASSAHIMPLAMTGRPDTSLIFLIISHENLVFKKSFWK